MVHNGPKLSSLNNDCNLSVLLCDFCFQRMIYILVIAPNVHPCTSSALNNAKSG